MSCFNIGFSLAKFNFKEMQQAFMLITESEKKDLTPIQIGLKQIEEVGNFFKEAANNSKINYFKNQEVINCKIEKLMECFSDLMFMATKGKIDILREDFKPQSDKNMKVAAINLKKNVMAECLLNNLIKTLINPMSEALEEIDKTIQDTLKDPIKLDDKEIKLLTTKLKLGTTSTKKPKNMKKSDFKKLNDLLDAIPKHKETLGKFQSALDVYGGLGVKIINGSVENSV